MDHIANNAPIHLHAIKNSFLVRQRIKQIIPDHHKKWETSMCESTWNSQFLNQYFGIDVEATSDNNIQASEKARLMKFKDELLRSNQFEMGPLTLRTQHDILLLEQHLKPHYTAYTDGSVNPETKHAGASYVIYDSATPEEPHAQYNWSCGLTFSSYQSELSALAILLDHACANKKMHNKTMLILTDSQSLTRRFMQLPITQSESQILQRIWQLVNIKHCKIHIQHVKAHVGIIGNETADALAKSATGGEGRPSYTLSNLKAIAKNKINQVVKDNLLLLIRNNQEDTLQSYTAELYFTTSQNLRKRRPFTPDTPIIIQRRILQLMTGNSNLLGMYLKKIKGAPTSHCVICGTMHGDIHHLLSSCSELEEIYTKLKGDMPKLEELYQEQGRRFLTALTELIFRKNSMEEQLKKIDLQLEPNPRHHTSLTHLPANMSLENIFPPSPPTQLLENLPPPPLRENLLHLQRQDWAQEPRIQQEPNIFRKRKARIERNPIPLPNKDEKSNTNKNDAWSQDHNTQIIKRRRKTKQNTFMNEMPPCANNMQDTSQNASKSSI